MIKSKHEIISEPVLARNFQSCIPFYSRGLSSYAGLEYSYSGTDWINVLYG